MTNSHILPAFFHTCRSNITTLSDINYYKNINAYLKDKKFTTFIIIIVVKIIIIIMMMMMMMIIIIIIIN